MTHLSQTHPVTPAVTQMMHRHKKKLIAVWVTRSSGHAQEGTTLNPKEFRILSVFKAKQLSQEGQKNIENTWLGRDQDEQAALLTEAMH